MKKEISFLFLTIIDYYKYLYENNKTFYYSFDSLESLYWVGDKGVEGIQYDEKTNKVKHIYIDSNGLVIYKYLD